MGEIDHADDAVDHGVADGDEAVDRPERQPVDELLNEISHRPVTDPRPPAADGAQGKRRLAARQAAIGGGNGPPPPPSPPQTTCPARGAALTAHPAHQGAFAPGRRPRPPAPAGRPKQRPAAPAGRRRWAAEPAPPPPHRRATPLPARGRQRYRRGGRRKGFASRGGAPARRFWYRWHKPAD